ncbi:Poly(A) RNA polymerase gld-4 [Bienertia sinuspersici]
MALLMEYKDKNKDKERIDRELEDQITKSIHEDDEDDEPEMQYATRQSQMQHEFDYYCDAYSRGRRGYYNEVHGFLEPTSTSAARLRSREVELGTGWLKKANKELNKAFGNWMLDTNQPFRSIEFPFTNPLMEFIREHPNVRAPSTYDIAEWHSSRYGQMPDELAVEVREFLSKNPSSCFLNPQYMYGNHDIGNDQELLKGVKNVIPRLERDVESQVRALQQIHAFRDKMDNDPLTEWLEETKNPVFDGDDLGWLNDDDIDEGGHGDTQDDDTRGLGTRPPFQYNTTQIHPSSVQSRQSTLSPPNSDNGGDSDGAGDGGH